MNNAEEAMKAVDDYIAECKKNRDKKVTKHEEELFNKALNLALNLVKEL